VAVPKPGKDWMNLTYVTGKYWQPDWVAPGAVRNDHPELPPMIPGGAPNNPMGLAAITLQQSEIAIHGTSNKMRSSIGTAASYGCIRMLNEDVRDLFSRVSVGARVLKTR
jgi:lipoprotein-anchoring transpeptidase ErfK/SrfK